MNPKPRTNSMNETPMPVASNVVVVTGTPRSGSTWFARVLGMHPDLDVYTHGNGDNHILYLLAPARALNPFAEDFLREPAIAGRWFDAARSRLLRSYFLPSAAGRTMVLATPTTAAFLPALARAFPDAKYIHLKRDPLDVASSFAGVLSRTAKTGSLERFLEKRRNGYGAGLRGVAAHAFHKLRWARLGHPGYLDGPGTLVERAGKRRRSPFGKAHHVRRRPAVDHLVRSALGQVERDLGVRGSESHARLLTSHEEAGDEKERHRAVGSRLRNALELTPHETDEQEAHDVAEDEADCR